MNNQSYKLPAMTLFEKIIIITENEHAYFMGIRIGLIATSHLSVQNQMMSLLYSKLPLYAVTMN